MQFGRRTGLAKGMELNISTKSFLAVCLCFISNSIGVPHVTWNCQENLQSLCSCITALKLPRPPPAAADGEIDTLFRFAFLLGYLFDSLAEFF